MNSEPQALKTYQLGRMQRLPILRLVSIGAYLDGGIQDILLPLRYLPKDAKVGDEVEVFVYHDNEGRLIATTLRPLAQVGEVAFLRCASVSEAGAFMEWGIHRDLFVPFREQSSKMLLGYSYAVYLYVDQMSGKIVGSARLSKHLGGSPADYAPGSLVHCIVTEQHEEGYRCVIAGQHWGFGYTDAAPRVREDNKVDLSLRPVGYAKVDGAQERLLELLEQAGGQLPLGDKSPAEEILRQTGMSKKTFKMALGALYKARRIELSPTSVRLSKEGKR